MGADDREKAASDASAITGRLGLEGSGDETLKCSINLES
jgi:hypothetical protein